MESSGLRPSEADDFSCVLFLLGGLMGSEKKTQRINYVRFKVYTMYQLGPGFGELEP